MRGDDLFQQNKVIDFQLYTKSTGVQVVCLTETYIIQNLGSKLVDLYTKRKDQQRYGTLKRNIFESEMIALHNLKRSSKSIILSSVPNRLSEDKS